MNSDERVLTTVGHSKLAEGLRDYEIAVLANLMTLQHYEVNGSSLELDGIAGITRQAHVGNFTLRARTDSDHSGDVTEMVIHLTPGRLASQSSLLNHLHKIAPILIIQQRGEIAGKPKFVAVLVNLTRALKGGVMLIVYALGVHGDSPAR